jgi:hypothetical protein
LLARTSSNLTSSRKKCEEEEGGGAAAKRNATAWEERVQYDGWKLKERKHDEK